MVHGNRLRRIHWKQPRRPPACARNFCLLLRYQRLYILQTQTEADHSSGKKTRVFQDPLT